MSPRDVYLLSTVEWQERQKHSTWGKKHTI